MARFLLALLALVMLAGCGRRDSDALYHEQLYTFGTLVEVSIWGEPLEKAQQATAELARQLEVMNRAWKPFGPGELGQLNDALPDGKAHALSPEVLPLVRRGQEFHRLSGGLFNPALGGLIRLWGFESDELRSVPPAEGEVRELLALHPGMDDVVLEGDTVRATNSAVRLNFGGYAKGASIDRAVELFRARGIHNAIVMAGGDMRIVGRRGDRAWRIGVKHPRATGILASLEVEGDQTVHTSGDYERFFIHEGTRYHHVLDPRTGHPARGAASVTIVHNGDATLADAASTTLLIAGPQDWPRLARAMGIQYVLMVDEQGVAHMTPAMAKRIRFEIDPPPKVVITELPQ